MGKHVTFSVSAWSSAPPRAVYDLLRDGATWPQWSPIGSFRLEREGHDGGESLGAIRVFRTATVSSREEIVGFEPGRSFSYSALSGMPPRADNGASGAATVGGRAPSLEEAVACKLPHAGSWSASTTAER